MITIVHGDDIVSSRKYLSEEKQRQKNFVIFEAEALTITDLVQNIEGKSLFDEKTAIVVENFLSKKVSKDTEEIVSFLNKHAGDSNVVFWEGKEISKKSLGRFSKSVNKLFKFPQRLFLFLDSIKPRGGKDIISLFHETIKNVEVELVFFMLIRQFRLLLALSDEKSEGTIDEVLRLAPWQRSKLTKQAQLFTKEELKNTYSKLCKIDVMQKTGGLNYKLTQAIDFFLLEI